MAENLQSMCQYWKNFNLQDLQQFVCTALPFDVDTLIISPREDRLALVGAKGIAVIDIPKQWAKYETNDNKIFYRTTLIGERLFMATSNHTLMQAAWHPGSDNDRHLLVLTSDNRLSLFNVCTPEHAEQTCFLDASAENSCDGSALRGPLPMALGDCAVAFDFAPHVELTRKQQQTCGVANQSDVAWPVFILWGNGDIYSLLTAVNMKNLGARLQGPLTMHPPAEDNYGTDACSIHCLHSEPVVLVIATSQGMLYHCVVLEECGQENSSWDAPCDMSIYRSVPRCSLYIYENVELQLVLNVNVSLDSSLVDDFGSHIRLHKDSQFMDRYYCSHNCGLHAVVLPWTHRFQEFCTGGENVNSLLVDQDEQAIVEHLICTKLVASSTPVPVLAVSVESDRLLESTLICLLATYECITLPLLHKWRTKPPAMVSEMPMEKMSSPLKKLYKEPFEERIQKILQRSLTNPLLRCNETTELTPQQCFELMSRATQVFREQYLQKQALAYDEINKRVHVLRELKKQQTDGLSSCQRQKTDLVKTARKMAEKYEDVKDKQQCIVDRLEKMLLTIQANLPQLSDAERNMNTELLSLEVNLRKLAEDIVQIRKKQEYQQKILSGWEEERQASKSNAFNHTQTTHLKTLLKQEGDDIADLVQQIQQAQVSLDT